ncbi:MAG: transposase [Methylococcales bacterium]
MSKFKDAKHFASWLGLCPGTRISGGNGLSAATSRTTNRAAQALKMAASNLRASQSAPGAYYRRLGARRQTRPKLLPPGPTSWHG